MQRRVKSWVLIVAACLAVELYLSWRCADAMGIGFGCCFGNTPTLSSEIWAADVSIIARLVGGVEPPGAASRDGLYRFEVVEILKGAEQLRDQQIVEAVYFGDRLAGSLFLIHASVEKELTWGSATTLSDGSLAYVRQLLALPQSGSVRLRFFYLHMHDADELASRDAHDELIAAPYADLKAAKDCFDHDRLVAAIRDEETLSGRRRLYLNMLGIVSRDRPQPEDLRYLERELNSNAEQKPCLDAMIGCYLTLRGAAALPMIEDKFLKDRDVSYADTYAAIMALRFHAEDENVIPRRRVLVALRLILDRPDLADIVIPDLARWEDWSSVNRLVAIFKSANDESYQWVRIPVLQFLKACPLPEAKMHLAELAKLDPTAFSKSNVFIPLGDSVDDDSP